MADKPQTSLATTGAEDPYALLRRITSELDQMWDEWPAVRWPATLRGFSGPSWAPRIDVVEKDNALITRVDLPGMKKEDVTVEVSDGALTLAGERKRESEEKKDNFYRSEREYGSFRRVVPLPKGVKLEDVKASFADGVLEVSVPLPARQALKTAKVKIDDGKAVKGAA